MESPAVSWNIRWETRDPAASSSGPRVFTEARSAGLAAPEVVVIRGPVSAPSFTCDLSPSCLFMHTGCLHNQSDGFCGWLMQLGCKDFADWLKPECYSRLEVAGWSAENYSHLGITR